MFLRAGAAVADFATARDRTFPEGTSDMSARRQAQTRRAQPRPWTGAVVIATRSEGEGSWNAIKSIPRDRVIAG